MKYIFDKIHNVFYNKKVGDIICGVYQHHKTSQYYSWWTSVSGSARTSSPFFQTLEEALTYLDPIIDTELIRMQDEIDRIKKEVV